MCDSDIDLLLETYKKLFEHVNLQRKEPIDTNRKNASNLRELNRISKCICTKLSENSRNLTERLKAFLQSADSNILDLYGDSVMNINVNMNVNRSNHYLKAHRLLLDIRKHNRSTEYMNYNNPTKSVLVKSMKKKEARLISWMTKFIKVHSRIEEEGSVPRGRCVLCEEEQQYYCGNCEERMKYFRQSTSLDIYANKLLRIKSRDVQSDIDEYLTQRIAYIKRKNEVEMKQQRMQYLKKMRDLLKSDYEKEEISIEKLKQSNTLRQLEIENLRNSWKKRLKKPSQITQIRQKRMDCSQLLINERRKKLRELKILLPITPRKDKLVFLQGEIQKNTNYKNVTDKENLGLVLGYQLLLVQQLSLYLGIPLKYCMKFMSSQSTIGLRSEKQLTLHPDSPNVEFEKAVKYLSRNVYNLVRQYNIIIECKDCREYPLVCLFFLMNKEDLGSLIPKMMLITTSMFRSMSTSEKSEKGFILVEKKTREKKL